MKVQGPDLGTGDTDTLAAFFVRYMTMEQRHTLMAEMPLLYKRLFPHVPAGVILEHVSCEMGA